MNKSKNVSSNHKKTIFHILIRKWSVVFLFVLIFPYIGSVFWSGDYIETNSSHVVNEFDGRIIVKEVTSGMDTEMPLEEYLYGDRKSTRLNSSH